MEYDQIGFSNIRLPSDQNSGLYTYSATNTFPEEVFVHEFLHTLERNEMENENDIIELHDYATYGYVDDNVDGLRAWYKDYMLNTINGGEGKGLTDFAYSSKPVHESNFVNSTKLDYLDEPENFIEELEILIKKVPYLISDQAT